MQALTSPGGPHHLIMRDVSNEFCISDAYLMKVVCDVTITEIYLTFIFVFYGHLCFVEAFIVNFELTASILSKIKRQCDVKVIYCDDVSRS